MAALGQAAQLFSLLPESLKDDDTKSNWLTSMFTNFGSQENFVNEVSKELRVDPEDVISTISEYAAPDEDAQAQSADVGGDAPTPQPTRPVRAPQAATATAPREPQASQEGLHNLGSRVAKTQPQQPQAQSSSAADFAAANQAAQAKGMAPSQAAAAAGRQLQNRQGYANGGEIMKMDDNTYASVLDKLAKATNPQHLADGGAVQPDMSQNTDKESNWSDSASYNSKTSSDKKKGFDISDILKTIGGGVAGNAAGDLMSGKGGMGGTLAQLAGGILGGLAGGNDIGKNAMTLLTGVGGGLSKLGGLFGLAEGGDVPDMATAMAGNGTGTDALKPGQTPENVADDVPIAASEGEYMVNSSATKYFGTDFFDNLQAFAEQKMQDLDGSSAVDDAEQDPAAKPTGVVAMANMASGGK